MESGGKKRKLVDSLFMTPLQKKKKLQELISADNKISIEGVAQSKAMKSSFENVTENMKVKDNFDIIPNLAPDISGKPYHGEKGNSVREATSAHDQLKYIIMIIIIYAHDEHVYIVLCEYLSAKDAYT